MNQLPLAWPNEMQIGRIGVSLNPSPVGPSNSEQTRGIAPASLSLIAHASRMTESIDKFIATSGLEDYDKYIRRGAFLAQSKAAFSTGRPRRDGLKLKDEERYYLDLEDSPRRFDKFKQPWRLYALVGVCSLGAAVQGW